MRFSEDGICELSSITTVDECEAYKAFLVGERDRHGEAMDDADEESGLASGLSDYIPTRLTGRSRRYLDAYAAFWGSASLRHQQDLDGITKRLKEIEAHRATLEVK